MRCKCSQILHKYRPLCPCQIPPPLSVSNSATAVRVRVRVRVPASRCRPLPPNMQHTQPNVMFKHLFESILFAFTLHNALHTENNFMNMNNNFMNIIPAIHAKYPTLISASRPLRTVKDFTCRLTLSSARSSTPGTPSLLHQLHRS